jgi:hypothetical protein
MFYVLLSVAMFFILGNIIKKLWNIKIDAIECLEYSCSCDKSINKFSHFFSYSLLDLILILVSYLFNPSHTPSVRDVIKHRLVRFNFHTPIPFLPRALQKTLGVEESNIIKSAVVWWGVDDGIVRRADSIFIPPRTSTTFPSDFEFFFIWLQPIA